MRQRGGDIISSGRSPARGSRPFSARVAQTRPPGEAGRGGAGTARAEVAPFGAAASHEPEPMPRERSCAAAAAGSPRGARGSGEDAGDLRKGEGPVPAEGRRGAGGRAGGGAVTVRLPSSLKRPLWGAPDALGSEGALPGLGDPGQLLKRRMRVFRREKTHG